MIEIKIDRASLPKDGQKIRWQTQSDIINGTWKEGVFCEEEDSFNVGFEDVVQHWDLAWDVHHWEVLSYNISDVSDSRWNMIPNRCEYNGKIYRILNIELQGGYFTLQDLEAERGDIQVLNDIDMDKCIPIYSH
jgi:hypothetical protein